MICAIVTAAGRSRRMGRQKLLLPYGGGTVLGRVVDQLLESDVDRVFGVIAAGDQQISSALAGLDVTRVINPDPDAEMLETIRCGLRALPPECDGVLVALGDQPAVSSELVNRLVDGFTATAPSIVVPVHGTKHGHPLLFHARFKEDVLTHFDGEGLRGLLRAYPQHIREVPVPERLMLTDMDLPEDYRRELAKLDGDQSGNLG